jgi:hypothetical protein
VDPRVMPKPLTAEAGLHKLNSADPLMKAAPWFQPLRAYKVTTRQPGFKPLRFKCNLRRRYTSDTFVTLANIAKVRFDALPKRGSIPANHAAVVKRFRREDDGSGRHGDGRIVTPGCLRLLHGYQI